MSIIIPTALAFIILSITSCSSNDLETTLQQQEQQLHEVTVTLSGIGFTLDPVTRATASEAEITRIALKVFNEDGNEVASVSQIESEAGDSFNKLKIQLPADAYTFVAVAHDASADNVGCATITSPEVVTLPEGIIPTLYAHVQQVTVANTSNQTVTINMGKRINSTIHLTSTDNVPDGVSKVAFDINPTGTYVSNEAPVRFNPTTGLVTGTPRYRRALDVTAGEPIDVSFNILIPDDPYNCRVDIFALGTDAQIIADYTRSFDAVPFKCAYVTNASGTFFRYVSNSSLNFDTTTDSHEFAY